MSKQDRRHAAKYQILEVQAWDERAGWQGAGARRKRTSERSIVHIASVITGSRASVVIVMLLTVAGLMFLLV